MIKGMRLVRVAVVLGVAACSSATNPKNPDGAGRQPQDLASGSSATVDMVARISDDMMMRSTDMAHIAGTGACHAFLSCVANCQTAVSCIAGCRSQVSGWDSDTALQAFIQCSCASCLQGSNPPCSSWDDGQHVTCTNCEYGELMPSANPQNACMSQYQACLND